MELLIGSVITCVLVAAGWFLFEMIAEGSLGALHGGLSRRAAAEALKAQKIRCGLRAPSGRVHGIGPEWSVGIATLRSGSLSFAPSVGVVGDRQIEVLAVEQIRSQTPPSRSVTRRASSFGL